MELGAFEGLRSDAVAGFLLPPYEQHEKLSFHRHSES